MCYVVICLFIAIVFAGFGIPISSGQQSKCVNNKLLSRNAAWNCVEIEKCEFPNTIPAKNMVSCGVQSICCPNLLTETDITNPTQEQIEEAKLVALNECYKYQGYRYKNWTDNVKKYKLDCGQVERETIAVAGGYQAKRKEFPFMALLGFSDDVSDKRAWQCGGTLINSQYILTAAHCTETGNLTLKWALLGTLSRTNITLELTNKTMFKVIQHIKHPLYKAGKSNKENNDIALLKLEIEVPLSPSIRPICLYHNETMAKVNSKAIVAGWGVTVAGQKESDNLQYAPINVLKSSRCADQFRKDPLLENGFNDTTMICGGDLKSGRDACPGDSGGPMLIRIKHDKCMYLQEGVVSLGALSCGKNKSAIYTRVSHYLPWIRSVAWSST